MIETGHDVRIIFTASNTLFGRLIRKLTGGTVSHAMLEYDSSLWGGRWIAEATVSGVRKVLSHKSRHNVICEYKFKSDPKKGCRAIAEYFGSAYDFAGIFWFAWFIIAWRWLKLKVRRPASTSKAQVCSELMARFVQPYLDKGLPWNPSKITPEELRQTCEINTTLFEPVDGLEEITPLN